MKIQKSKGSRDLSPEEMGRFRLIEGAFREACQGWGYQEVRTPTLEYLHLFTAAGTLTPALLGRVYSFLDWDGWSGERVVLRPDGTIPVARYYIENLPAKSLARLFYVTNVFIFEETGKKSREKWQCGAELIGADAPLADAELVDLAFTVLRKLDIDGVGLRLSHAGLLRTLIAQLGLAADEQHRVLDQVLDGDLGALARIKHNRPELNGVLLSLLELKGKSAVFLKNLKGVLNGDLPEVQPSLDNLIQMSDLLSDLGIDYQIDITLGRGFEYYTGVIFQFFTNGEELGGGGRYNDLITQMGGQATPACGFALYLNRLMNLVPAESLPRPAPRVLVRVGREQMKEGAEAARRLREAGYRVEFDLGGRAKADFDWTVEVAAGKLVLTRPAQRQRHTAATVAETLEVMRGAR